MAAGSLSWFSLRYTGKAPPPVIHAMGAFWKDALQGPPSLIHCLSGIGMSKLTGGDACEIQFVTYFRDFNLTKQLFSSFLTTEISDTAFQLCLKKMR